MAFTRPTLEQIVTRTKTDFESRLTNGKALLRRAVLRIIPTVIAGAAHLLYGFIDWVYKQVFIDTAEAAQLRRWAKIFNVQPTPAAFSQGQVTFTGVEGTVIDAGLELQRSDGQIYTVDTGDTIGVSGEITLDVTASEAGVDGDCDENTSLSVVSGVSGLSTEATVASGGLIGGADAETDDALRARLLERIQNPPNGGAENDYVKWAKEVSGVTRAWVLPLYLGASNVGVTFVRDNDSGSIIPSGGEVTEVQDYIDDPTRRPVTADVTVFAPTAVPLNFNITLSPNTADTKAAVQAELEDLILREAEPGGTIKLSHINEAISLATGEDDHVLNSPVADVTVTTTQLTTMGTITWA